MKMKSDSSAFLTQQFDSSCIGNVNQVDICICKEYEKRRELIQKISPRTFQVQGPDYSSRETLLERSLI